MGCDTALLLRAESGGDRLDMMRTHFCKAACQNRIWVCGFFHMEICVLHAAIGKGKQRICDFTGPHPWKMIRGFVVLVLDTRSLAVSELPH